MASDVAASIVGRNSCLAAECGNQSLVQIALSDNCEAVQEKEIDHLCGFAVCHLYAFRANLLPGGNHLATIRSTGLVNAVLVLLTGTSSMQTAPPARVSPLPGNETSSRCPANAAQAQTQYLIVSQAREQPCDGQRFTEFDRVTALKGFPSERAASREVLGGQVQPGPHQFGPNIVGNGTRLRPNLRKHTLGRNEAADRIEPARD